MNVKTTEDYRRAKQYIKNARILFHQEKYTLAIEELEKAIKIGYSEKTSIRI